MLKTVIQGASSAPGAGNRTVLPSLARRIEPVDKFACGIVLSAIGLSRRAAAREAGAIGLSRRAAAREASRGILADPRCLSFVALWLVLVGTG